MPAIPEDESSTSLTCFICDIRNSVKKFFDYQVDPNGEDYGEDHVKYCFPCFTNVHGDNPETRDHRIEDIETVAEDF